MASQKSTPLAALVDPSQQIQGVNEQTRRVEQIVLLVRALQLMSSGLELASKQLKSGQLRASSTVKTGKILCLLCFGPFLESKLVKIEGSFLRILMYWQLIF